MGVRKMTDREKLIELIEDTYIPIRRGDAEVGRYTMLPCEVDAIADRLIANGVTFATDNNVGSKWIPVTERLPEPWKWVLCYCEAGVIEMLRYDEFIDEWGSVNLNRAFKKEYVTHWMPLPEPPKGE